MVGFGGVVDLAAVAIFDGRCWGLATTWFQAF